MVLQKQNGSYYRVRVLKEELYRVKIGQFVTQNALGQCVCCHMLPKASSSHTSKQSLQCQKRVFALVCILLQHCRPQRAEQTTKPFSREVLLTLLQLSTRLQVDSSCGCDEDIVKHM